MLASCSVYKNAFTKSQSSSTLLSKTEGVSMVQIDSFFDEEKIKLFNKKYQDAETDYLSYWDAEALKLAWFAKWHQTLQWKTPKAYWFKGGILNACYNCLDVHIKSGCGSKVALKWEGERGDQTELSYSELYDEVNRFSHVLKSLGIQKGDTVSIYMPMIKEAVIAMLSCARIGAIHSVVFAGFSAQALKDRMQDLDAKLLITADGGYRKGKIVPLKQMADEAACLCKSLKNVLVIKHTNLSITMNKGLDVFYDDLRPHQQVYVPPEPMSSEDPLFVLYTSGTTGKPKGIVHSTGGYLVGVRSTMDSVFDIKATDIMWCTADVGWITGHSYLVYGPLMAHATIVMYEGVPDYPEKDRFWKIIEKYQVTIFYTAPTAIRMFMKWGHEWTHHSSLESLRLLGSVGEPINPEAWMWYYKHIGKMRCPIVDTYWQTETGSILMAPVPFVSTLKAGSPCRPLPGISMQIVDEEGKASPNGFLTIEKPWPSMLIGIFNDQERFKKTYFSRFGDDIYVTGDGALMDKESFYTISGRVDDVINVSGHRLGTMEIESAFVEHPQVAEAAAIGMSHPIKGQAVVAFVTLRAGFEGSAELEALLKNHIDKVIGPIARPEKITFMEELPKTRSGKIMRRLLKDIAEQRPLGDMTSLSDVGAIHAAIQKLNGS